MVDINKIENKTLAKLTRDEIGLLDLVNNGVGLYRGDLKTRYNGMKRQTEDGVTFWFEGTTARIEFTEIVGTDPEGRREWAARIYRKPSDTNAEGHYETYPMGIIGCDYFR